MASTPASTTANLRFTRPGIANSSIRGSWLVIGDGLSKTGRPDPFEGRANTSVLARVAPDP